MEPAGRTGAASDAASALASPCAPVRPLLARAHVGFSQAARTFDRWLMPPPSAVTVILNVAEPFGGLPAAFIAGLDDTYSLVELGGAVSCVDVKLTPPGAYRLFGRPMSELTGRSVDIADVLGAEGGRLAERLRDAPDWTARFAVLDGFLAARAEDGPTPAPEVEWAWRRLMRTRGRVSIGALARDVGWSHKHLITRFKQQVGLPPRAFAQVVRFNALLRAIDGAQGPVRWTELAHACGYYDQAHLDRDFRRFAGTTPTDFLTRRMPGGSVVGDGVKTVQDARRHRA